MPLIKSLFVLTHESAMADVKLLSEELKPLLQGKDMMPCVRRIQDFWGKQLPPAGLRGSFWRELVAVAHMEPGDEFDLADYSKVTQQLRHQLSTIFPGLH